MMIRGERIPLRPSRYTCWASDFSYSRLEKALDEIRQGKSVREAADEYGIPKSTLGDYSSCRRLPGCKQGREKALSDPEEEALVNFIVGCADVGYGKSVREVYI